ncbi:MAG: hypothetical protein LBH05_03555 [Deferribacteraceae bacterium]|jgi:photosystem II stability/assembly factor-like uncharacterized protein|nr:hypothetical protein [Deferribacteraceae bacterium]
MLKRTFILFLLIIIVSCGGSDNDRLENKSLNWSSAHFEIGFDIRSIACGDNGTVIAVGNDGGIAKSENGGDAWAPSYRIPGITCDFNGIAYCNGRFIIAGDNHTIQYSDNDGRSWLQRSSVFTEINYKSVTCNGSNFLLGGETTLTHGSDKFDNRTALSVNNGASWESYKAGGVIPDNIYIGINHLMFGSGRYYLATDSGLAGYSSDGKDWRTLPTSVDAVYNFTGMAQGADNGTKLTLFSAIAKDNTTGILVVSYNDNLTEWKNAGLPATAPVRGVAFGKDLFVVITDKSIYLSDNVTGNSAGWREGAYPPLTNLTNHTINTVTYCGNAFWIGTNRGQILRALYR